MNYIRIISLLAAIAFSLTLLGHSSAMENDYSYNVENDFHMQELEEPQTELDQLIEYAEKDELEAIKKIVGSEDFDVNKRYQKNKTLLMLIAEKTCGKADVLKCILAAKADPLLKDNKGKMAWSYSYNKNDKAAVDVLTFHAVRDEYMKLTTSDVTPRYEIESLIVPEVKIEINNTIFILRGTMIQQDRYTIVLVKYCGEMQKIVGSIDYNVYDEVGKIVILEITDEQSKGKGLGKVLLQQACSHLRSLGCMVATLRVRDSGENYIATNLYLQAGFKGNPDDIMVKCL